MSSEQQLDLMGAEDVDLETLLANMDQIDNGDPKLWPKTLADLMSVAQHQLARSLKIKSDEAYPVARDMIAALAHYMGGRQVYLPRDDRLQRALRDIHIYQAFTGRNHQQLADRYELTTMQIYSILAEQKKLHLARTQPDMFPT